MQISLSDIKTFSKCPKYYWFLQKVEKKPTPQDISLSYAVIKKAYIITAETSHKVEWRRIVGWVDSIVFRNINVEDREQFNAARILSEHILNFIQRWYHKIYLPEQAIGYADVPVSIQLGEHCIYTTCPIVKVGDIPYTVHISDTPKADKELRRDLLICGSIALLAKELGYDAVGCEYLSIGLQGGYNNTTIVIRGRHHNRICDHLQHIAQSINAGVSYPSVTDQCKVCSFRRRCI
jgi:CRISPR/Cas system-associated exonuclease Cas4 (RecB family)